MTLGPWHRKVLFWVLTGVVGFGAVLDIVNNAISILTPTVATVITLVVVVTLAVAPFVLPRLPIYWSSADESRMKVRAFGPQVYCGCIGVVLLSWLAALFPETEDARIAENRAENKQLRNSLDAKEHQLDEMRKSLDAKQRQLDEVRELETRRRVAIAEISGRASVLGARGPDKEVLALAAELRALTDKFEAASAQLSDHDQMRIRLARATIANVEERYADALELVGTADLTQAARITDTSIAIECSLLRARADALFGLHRWQDALPLYERLRALTPNDTAAMNSVATCLLYLEDYDKARQMWQSMADTLSNNYEHGVEGAGMETAACFGNLGGVSASLGDYGGATQYLTSSISMYSGLLKQKRSPQLGIDLARTLIKRGAISADREYYSESDKDYSLALSLLEQFTTFRVLAPDNSELAYALGHRAALRLEQGRPHEALTDIQRTVSMYTTLITTHEAVQYKEERANSLITRGIILAELLSPGKAINDFTEAYNDLSDLRRNGRADLGDELANVLRHRAAIYMQETQYEKAVADIDEANAILRPLLLQGKRLDLVEQWLVLVDSNVQMFYEAFRLTNKKDHLKASCEAANESVRGYRGLVANRETPAGRRGLANALDWRGRLSSRLGNFEAAEKDFLEAISIYQQVVKHGRNPNDVVRLAQTMGRGAFPFCGGSFVGFSGVM